MNYFVKMNGIDNPSSTIQNVNNNSLNENKQNHQIIKKTSPLTILSLTLHSLGIIFGDM
jgi:hypothetical protein